MKKSLLACLLGFAITTTFAAPAATPIKLTIKFDSLQNKAFYKQPIHYTKTITINPNQKINYLINTSSIITGNLPVTIAFMVRPDEVKPNQIGLQFNLIDYGFSQRGSIISQPKVILKNGQPAKLSLAAYQFQVRAHWKTTNNKT